MRRRVEVTAFVPHALVILLAVASLAACGPEQGRDDVDPLNSSRLDELWGPSRPGARPVLPRWATPEELRRAVSPPPRRARSGEGASVSTSPATASALRVPAEFEATRLVVLTWAGFPRLLEGIATAAAAAGAEVWAVGGPARLRKVPPSAYRALPLDYDSVWVRDYGPIGVDAEAGGLVFVDTLYRHGAYRASDDELPCRVAAATGAACERLDLVLDGGNFMTDGRGGLFMTRRTLDWNRSLSQAHVERALRERFGVQRIHWFDYAKLDDEPADGTGHIDMFAKLVAPCRVLVARAAESPFAETVDAAAATFEGLECQPGRSFEVLRVPGWYTRGTWYTYTNALVVNGAVLVPSYARGSDAEAESVYRQAMPEHSVVMLPSDESITSGGSIHCVTRDVPSLAAGAR